MPHLKCPPLTYTIYRNCQRLNLPLQKNNFHYRRWFGINRDSKNGSEGRPRPYNLEVNSFLLH